MEQEPKYTVTRIKTTTLGRIKILADRHGISKPKMLDKMLEYFEMVDAVMAAQEGKDDGKDISPPGD